MEYKFASLEWKADEEGMIEGYGSVFDVVDNGGDIIAPGAFKQSLASGRKVKMLYQHDASAVIGTWKTVEEDQKGLRVSGKILTTVKAGSEAYEYVKAGAIDGLSIGYRTVKSMDRNGKRVIMQAELWEVSLVTFPMNEMARIDAVKAAEAFKDFQEGNAASLKRNVEEYLREAGFSNVEAKAGASALASKIGAMREAGTGLDELADLLRQRARV
jgi:uncharacterized protein